MGKPGQYPRIDPGCQCRKTGTCQRAEVPMAKFDSGDTQIDQTINRAGEILKEHAENTYQG